MRSEDFIAEMSQRSTSLWPLSVSTVSLLQHFCQVTNVATVHETRLFSAPKVEQLVIIRFHLK